MSKNQFFYTRKELVQPVIKGKEKFNSFKCSFNTKKVIRSEELENGNVLVLLDDLHQRWSDVEVKNSTGEVTSIKREVNTFQSEIYLTEARDIQRFHDLSDIEGGLTPIYNDATTHKT